MKTISLFRWKSACIVGLRVWVCVRARLDSNGLMRYLCNMCVFVFCRSFLLYVLANLCLHTLFLHTLFRLKRPRPYGIGCFYLFQSIFCVVFYFWEKKIVSSVCARNTLILNPCEEASEVHSIYCIRCRQWTAQCFFFAQCKQKKHVNCNWHSYS